MKKLFTLAAAMLASVSMFAELPLTALPEGGIDFTNGEEAWGSTKDKNKVIYNSDNTIMMFSQGNALSFSDAGMLIGNSSKVSAFVFRTSAAADITLNLGYNNSDATVTLYYMGEETDVLTSSNLNTPGTKTCGSAAVTSGTTPTIIAKAADAGYYKVVGSLRFAAKSIVLSAPTAADHSAATVTAIKADGVVLADFAADKSSYDIELEFDATAAPVISAETADDATVQITQAAAVPGAATVVCTSYDQTNSVTYTINFTLESPAPIIRATLTSGTAATVKGSIGGTADVSLSSNLKMDKGKYFGIALPEGQTFMEGDSVVISMTTAGGNYPCLFEDKTRTNCLFLATEGSSALEYTIMLPAAADGISTLYLARDADDATYKWNPTLKSISVFRPVDDGQPKLNVNKEAITLNVTAERPSVSETLVFSGKHLTPGVHNLVVPNLAGLTVAPTAVTVAEDGKLNASVVVTYATEADVEAASTAISLTIGALVAEVAINYSAVQTKAYINASVNIEGGIVADGKSFGTVAALQAAGWEIAQVDSNDSLNNSKGAGRNEDYLGLKLNKSTAAYLAGWVRQGDVLRVKFGNIPTAVLVSLNNGEAIEHTAAVYEYTATEDTYVKFAPKATDSKLVLKQVMLNAAIIDVMYKVTYAAAENGKVEGWTIAFPNETVELTVTPNNGYKINQVFAGNEVLVPVEDVYSFVMPAQEVTVSATFEVDPASAISNTNANVKAVKVVRNGQLFIEKNGVVYNAQGAIVK